MIDLSFIWATIIAVGILIYVVLDGFDLGIGILFPFFKDETDRNVLMNTIAPVWDGNETWMVLGGAGLFAAFPLVYSAVLSALYMPVILMVIFLIFRGVAFEFRFKANRTKHLWDLSFILGSTITTFLQGVILGAYIQGINIQDGRYVGGGFDWLTPFSLFCGVAVIVAYATLACGWLIIKTTDELQINMYKLMPRLILILLAMFGVVSLWTPFTHPDVAERWFSTPNIYYFSFVPLLVLYCAYKAIRASTLRRQLTPFIATLGLVFLAYIGFLISLWPMIVPPSITIWEAAAPEGSQLFTLIGALLLIPIILTYTGLSYWVFRGKVRADDEGYH